MKYEWEYSCLICRSFSKKTQGGSSNHWGYLVTTTAELRTCALSIKPLGSMKPRLTLKNWENVNVHHLFGHLSASGTKAITANVEACARQKKKKKLKNVPLCVTRK